MAIRRYLNFDLLLEQLGEGQYQARVTESPLDGTPSVRFQLPFDAQTLEVLLLKLDPGRSGTRRVGATSQQQAAMDFGGPLFEAVFAGEIALAWQRSLDLVRVAEAEGLRLRLLLGDAPAIAGLPWELLYDAHTNSFIAQSERTPVVRFLDLPQRPRPMTVDGPLRVLVVISSPIDLVELDVEAEWRRMREALEPPVDAGLVALDRLPTATVAQLGAWLRRHQTHVVHFVGHGDFDDRMREGVVYFQDERGRGTAVTSSILGPYLRDHDPLRMVVLNACRSARSDGIDPFGGMAQGLVQQDATAVVAMQFPISDRAAVRFTGDFYGAVVDGLPVDQAVSSCRKSLMAEYGDEWSTPVLFMRSPDGVIFENVHAARSPHPSAAPIVPQTPPTLPPGQAHGRRRPLRLLAAAGAVLLAVALVLAVLRPWDDSGPTTASGPNSDASHGAGQSDVVDPTTAQDPEVELPRSARLSDSQMLLAASDDEPLSRHIWLFDMQNSDRTDDISLGDLDDTAPVLSPDRRTMMFSRLKPNTPNDYELYVAAARTGADDRPMFDPIPSDCAGSAGRPAWAAPDGEPQFLVIRCRDAAGVYRLVKAGLDGTTERLDVLDPTGAPWAWFGNPTVSPDGSMVVVRVADDAEARGGYLHAITLEDRRNHELSSADDFGPVFGDPVFSPSTDELILAVTDRTEATIDIDIVTLRGPLLVSLSWLINDRLFDEVSPSFSSDGKKLAYLLEDLGDEAMIMTVPVNGVLEDARAQGRVARYQSSLAWSAR